ncbi:ankyrin repeat protein [Apiospora sp. TS-2023a]
MGIRDRFSKFMKPPPKVDDESPSLWDIAYDQLKTRDRGLIEEYEEVLLSKQQNDDEATALALSRLDDRPLERRAQMQDMAEHSLQRMAESRQGKFLGKFTDTMAVLSSVKGVVDSAVKVSPEASTVWAGICFVIPFVENLAESTTAMQHGFVYLTSRMEYYAAFERVLFRPAQVSDSLDSLVKANKPGVVRLYGQIIEYIVQCVIQIHHSRTKQAIRGMLNLDDWKKKLTAVQETETLVARNAEQMGTAQGQETITKIRDSSMQSVELLQSFIDISIEQLRQDREMATKNHQILSQQLKLSETAEQRALTQQERDCLGAFTQGQQDYADWKDLVARRLEGTCQWLLKHEKYLEWEKQSSGPILISADPGCGKSVLAKFLVDEQLPSAAPGATICYFFFKDQVQNTLEQALCAIIHQILTKRHSLMRNIKDHRSATRSISSLWSVLSSLVHDPEAGQVICVFDALDECRNDDRRRLAGLVRELFRISFPKGTAFKLVMTSRPYETITSSFGNLHGDFPTIRIPGESELAVISNEINLVIKHRVRIFSKECNLKDTLAAHMEQRLLEIPHRTYLWIYLIFDYLEGVRSKEPKLASTKRCVPSNEC